LKVLAHLKEYLGEASLISPDNTRVVGLLGATSHLLFYLIYKYGFLVHENIWLRLTAAFLCVSVMFMHRLPSSFRPYLPYYWHFTLSFSLPFIFTALLLTSNFHELWLFSEIAMVYLLMIFVPNWLIFTMDLIIGITGAIVFYLLSPSVDPLNPTFNIPAYITVLGFSLFAGYIFSFSNWKSLKEAGRKKSEDKHLALEALAGSIAHEMRNPLSQIRHNIDESLFELTQGISENKTISFSAKNIETINKRLSQAQMALNRGLHVITMTLGNFRNTDVSHDELICLSATAVTRKAIE